MSKVLELLILRGIPASGKSTFAKKLVEDFPITWKRVNRDDLRLAFSNGLSNKKNEKFILEIQTKIIRSALKNGFNVVVDNTHLVKQRIDDLLDIAKDIGDVKVTIKNFDTSLSECLRRNSLREGSARVPDSVIRAMSKPMKHILASRDHQDDIEITFECQPWKPMEQNKELPKAILCDLDGTLAIISGRSPYDASCCDELDLPNYPVINCILAMYQKGYEIIFLSGRDSKYRIQTEKFINKYVRTDDLSTIKYSLYMRSEGDIRKDSIIKKELFDEYVKDTFYVEFVLDDRNQVVDLWRSIGLSCFQVNYGDF